MHSTHCTLAKSRIRRYYLALFKFESRMLRNLLRDREEVENFLKWYFQTIFQVSPNATAVSVMATRRFLIPFCLSRSYPIRYRLLNTPSPADHRISPRVKHSLLDSPANESILQALLSFSLLCFHNLYTPYSAAAL